MAARPKASENRETRRDLVDAALELFADKGFHGTSMRDIARAVGVRESALYNYFPSKEALFEAILLGEPDAGAPPLAPPLPPLFDGPAEELPAYLERILLAAVERFSMLKERKRFRVFLHDGARLAAEGRLNFFERLGVHRQVAIRVLQHLIDRGLLRGSAEMLGVEFAAPMMFWRMFMTFNPDHPFVAQPQRFVRAHVEHFLRAAGTTPPPPPTVA